jgi:hypothetical protein
MAEAARESATTTEKNRGRIETRTLTSTTVGLDTCDWPGARQMLRLERMTTEKGATRRTVSYAITSASRQQADARTLLASWRGRWGVESVFWIKDAVLREDHSRIRTKGAPFVMSHIRNAFITMCRVLQLTSAAATVREHALKLDVLLARLGILN